MRNSKAHGLVKRSMQIGGHRTSMALEPVFWAELEKHALLRNVSLPRLIGEIDKSRQLERPKASLASSVRVFVLLAAPAARAQPVGR